MVEGLVPHGNAKVMAGFLGARRRRSLRWKGRLLLYKKNSILFVNNP
jgi:hypothetical protein